MKTKTYLTRKETANLIKMVEDYINDYGDLQPNERLPILIQTVFNEK